MTSAIINSLAFLNLVNCAKKKTLRAQEIYIPSGTTYTKLFYIKKGIIRSYYLTESGEEKTIFFRWEDHITALPECILNVGPSRQNWQALEDCELYEIDFTLIDNISKKSKKLLQARLEYSQAISMALLQRLEGFILLNAEERYKKLISENRAIVNRVADKYIASYIGITPVSLSRIRRRLTEEK